MREGGRECWAISSQPGCPGWAPVKLSPLPHTGLSWAGWVTRLSLRISGQGGRSASQHVDKRGGKQASLVGGRLQDPLHPVVILGLLGQDDDNIAFFKCKLIFVVRL